MDTKMLIWYNVSIVILAFLLYRPVKKIILTGRIKKTERKLGRKTTEEEKKEIEKRTKTLAIAIVLLFSLLFNLMLAGQLFKPK